MSALPPTQGENLPLRPAGFFTRLEAWIIDLVLITLIDVGAVVIFHQIINFFLAPFVNRDIDFSPIAPYFALGLLVVYYLFFWSLLGFTPGKFLLGLKIVRPDGRKIGFGRALVRFIGYWISAIFLLLGYLWIIFDRRRQGWHDKLADTQVVYTWTKK
jgi:uncharacterized RDD family membrane protein YckC